MGVNIQRCVSTKTYAWNSLTKWNCTCMDKFLHKFRAFSICSHNFKGRNAEAKKTIVDKKYITFAEALVCLNDLKIHPKLHSYYLEFIMSVFIRPAVEVSGTDIENIWRCYVSFQAYIHGLWFSSALLFHFVYSQKWGDITPTLELTDIVDFTEYNTQIQELQLIVKKRLVRTLVSGLSLKFIKHTDVPS